ncbi:ABC transporter substrate-binding protein [Ramlibacter sp. G-1-2-2]|uniref:ABC transporter substrate-binding protein n=1 Tax=Ramlibacter agri TaxID=2728837 RepID=A0A848H5I9_9BURK|nr:substrate-binding domain-containing protein [Ramlibacter agri]NML42978.1 ABC transporter substrate-binding protein [Ramlibacter agri]
MPEARILQILSGGAAHGLVRKLQPAFEEEYGCRLAGSFGAVGAMRDQLVAGAPCDLLILTESLIADLSAQGHAVGATSRPLGVVRTGIAVQLGAQEADLSSPAALKALLEQASAIYMPDPAKATAGIHFMKMLAGLGLAAAVAAKLRTFPNGTTAMTELGRSQQTGAVGCTQVPEILSTPGVKLAGLLPEPWGLATTYSAAVCSHAAEATLAVHLIGALTAAEAAATRRDCGFDPAR